MPIFTAIGTAIAGALFAGSALAASLISGALAFGAKYLIGNYLNRQKKRSYSAVQGESQIGGAVPVSTLYGIGSTMGHRLFYAKYGSGNKYNAEVFRLANGWCDGLEPEIYFYGNKHLLVPRAIIGNEIQHWGVQGFDNLISIRFYDGRPGQLADAKLVADTANLGKTWKSTSRCSGMAYVIVEREWNEEKLKDRPTFQFVLRGLREYDPRKDSTVAGGSGAQRLNNSATWVFTKNPAVHRLNYQLGLRGLISGRALIGEGKSLGQLDLGTYFAAMNVADTLRAGKPTYQCGLFVNSDDDHSEILKEFDDAMAGYGLNRRGLSGVIPGAPQIAVLEVTAVDIPADRAKQVKFRKSSFDLYNQLSGQFTSPASQWQPQSLKPIVVNADVAADKRARATSNDFLQVSDPDIGQYLLNIRYRQQRKGGKSTLPVSRRVGLAVQEGEWIVFRGKTWLITNWACDARLRITLTLAETGADVYAEGGIEPGPIVIPSTPPVNPSLLSTVQNFNIEVGMINGAAGNERPALRFTWTPPADPTITAVRFFYFIGDNPIGQTIYEDQTTDVEKGEYVTSKNVQSGVHYTGRATITTVPDRFKTFTPWVTTAATTGKTIYPVELDQLADDVENLQNWIGGSLREVLNELERLGQVASDQDSFNFRDKQTIRTEIKSTTDTITAAYTDAIIVATGPNSALAQRITTLEVTIPTLATASAVNLLDARVTAAEGSITSQAASITSLQAALNGYTGPNAVATAVNSLTVSVSTAQSTADDALSQTSINATAITALNVAMGDASADGTFRIETGYTPAAGWTSRIGLQARVNSGGVFRDAGIFIETTAALARVIIKADQFIVTDGAANTQPFVFTGGVAYMENARIGDVYFRRMRSFNGGLDIRGDGSNASIEIYTP